MGVSENGVLIIRILLFEILYEGPLFSETPIYKSLNGTFIIDCLKDLQARTPETPKPYTPKPEAPISPNTLNP